MPNEIVDIVARFRAQVEAQDSINSFLFDDISALNGFKDTDYPVIILKPPDIDVPNIRKQDDDYKIDIFLYDLFKQKEAKDKSLEQKWSDMQIPLYEYIAAIQDPVTGHIITNAIIMTLGHDMHNDNLIAIRARFTLRVVSCRV